MSTFLTIYFVYPTPAHRVGKRKLASSRYWGIPAESGVLSEGCAMQSNTFTWFLLLLLRYADRMCLCKHTLYTNTELRFLFLIH